METQPKIRGLIIGKFMPPHQGHILLMEHAVRLSEKKCDELVVCVCSRPDEPIDGALRFKWMKQIVASSPVLRDKVKLFRVSKNLPQDKEPSREASKIWAGYLKKRFGRFDYVYTSEGYGPFLAEYLGCIHAEVDPMRKMIPVSATAIRQKPLSNWDYIPEPVRPYFIKRICLYGPESTGKSTLARQLAEHFHTAFAEEWARAYIDRNLGHNWQKELSLQHFEKIARGHLRAVEEKSRQADKLLFVDTDAITTMIYSQVYLKDVPKAVYDAIAGQKYDYYLFCDIDLPWTGDCQRDLGERRQQMKEIFLRELHLRSLPFAVISGAGENRIRNAIAAVEQYIARF